MQLERAVQLYIGQWFLLRNMRSNHFPNVMEVVLKILTESVTEYSKTFLNVDLSKKTSFPWP